MRGLPVLDAWLTKLEDGDLVVHHTPDTEAGFFYVPRRVPEDHDLIREPVLKTTRQRSVD